MCGIFFSLSHHQHVLPSSKTQKLLERRGPDASRILQVLVSPEDPSASSSHATFLSTVLSLRGSHLVSQPLLDNSSGSILCWNGEAWKIGGQPVVGNDSEAVFDLLLKACSGSEDDMQDSSHKRVLAALSTVTGPFAFVFYDAANKTIYYGRDCLGRRSLLRKITSDAKLIISSICDNDTGDEWVEVKADGIYAIDLTGCANHTGLEGELFPQLRKGENQTTEPALLLPFPLMNKVVAADLQSVLDLGSPSVHQLEQVLRNSLNLRVRHVRDSFISVSGDTAEATTVAILFSGGLDCTVLARLCHDILPQNESVDLLNVAFQNPRVHKALDDSASPFELCPDRVTGRASFAELKRVCPGRRWRFVEVNVPYSETLAHRGAVMTLMHPHNTEMDLSISYALYFASRGIGQIAPSDEVSPALPYTTPAHVLLSGLGADELFGGYQRHAVAFSRRGHLGLIEELELDFDRLGKRNLGRDDRVISDSGKEVRFPYLDEDLIAWALECPVWGKCGFGEGLPDNSNDPAVSLEPGKKVLRLLAWRLGMEGVATEKKRAIQFGARTAKMETGRTKGTQILS